MLLLKNVQALNDTSARNVLRRASDASHRRMHELKPFARIGDGTLLISHYRLLLESLYIFHSAVGEAADQNGLSSVSSSKRRLELLHSDITALGDTVPIPVSDWNVGTSDSVLGALYVAEGSMLGGRVIARQLDYLFGPQQEGRRFFFGEKSDHARWSRLLAMLGHKCTNPHALNAAIDGAQSTFDWFELCVTAYS